MLEQTSYAQWIGATLGEYRLTRLLGASPVGPLFVADSLNSTSESLIRVLMVPPAQTPEMMNTYQAYLERQAGHIVTLRHPYMLPLVNYGIFQGLPYFVWPSPNMRSLTTRLTQSGVLDVVTTGRYLDQVAATLEYAHQHATFHRNLSLDCIYLQLDGQIAVADFGVRRLVELLTPGGQTGFFYGSLEALAPEQLTGGQVGSFTDVYALGAVVYRLLTGHSVFSGESFSALAEQHLHAPPPPLARMRAGLPAVLDRVLVGALAKDPAQRIQHPGTFADAYHQVIATSNTRRVPFDAASGLPGAGLSPSPQSPQSLPSPRSLPSPTWRADVASPAPRFSSGPATPANLVNTAAPTQFPAITAPTVSRGWRQFLGRSWWFLLLILVLVPLITVGGFFLANNRPGAGGKPGGTLLFLDSAAPPDGNTNGLRLSVNGLASPAAGSQYEVWLVNRKTEQIIALGKLAKDSGQTYQLVYASPGTSGKPGENILAAGDMVEITEETSNVAAPSGRVLLSVVFPEESFIHIKHLLLAFDTTPGKIGLLVGVLRQTRALATQASALDQAAKGGQTALVRCLAQSIVDISEGSHSANFHPLDQACIALGVTEAGDGFGLLNPAKVASGYPTSGASSGYIKNAADHASLATGTPDATEALRQHAVTVQTELAAVTKSVTAADTAALTLLTQPTDSAAVTALAAAGSAAYQGSGGPAVGGAVAAYQQGQLMAQLALTQVAA